MQLVANFTSAELPVGLSKLDPGEHSKLQNGPVIHEVLMNIGQLARLAGVPIDTVRYYERQQLLPTARRSAGGYRVFSGSDLTRLQFIRRAKTLDFSLDEIADLLGFSDQRGQDMAQIRDSAVNKLTVIEQRIGELQRMHGALKQLVDACPGHGDQERCPILTALTDARP